MVQVQLDCMQLCHWSMLTAGCKVHRAGELGTFDTTMNKPSKLREASPMYDASALSIEHSSYVYTSFFVGP